MCYCDCDHINWGLAWLDAYYYSPNAGSRCINHKEIPQESGVYLLVSETEIEDFIHRKIEYVGSSYNLYRRLSSHPVKRLLNNKGIYVALYFWPCKDYLQREYRMIEKYKPPYNVARNKEHTIVYEERN